MRETEKEKERMVAENEKGRGTPRNDRRECAEEKGERLQGRENRRCIGERRSRKKRVCRYEEGCGLTSKKEGGLQRRRKNRFYKK